MAIVKQFGERDGIRGFRFPLYPDDQLGYTQAASGQHGQKILANGRSGDEISDSKHMLAIICLELLHAGLPKANTSGIARSVAAAPAHSGIDRKKLKTVHVPMSGKYRWFFVLVLSTIAAAIAGGANGGEPRPAMLPQTNLAADILLAPGGELSGRILSSERTARAQCPAELWRLGRLVAVEQTAVDGSFVFSHLDGGSYQLVAADRVYNCRLWSAGAAPPCAVDELVVTVGDQVVRGQNYNPFPYPRSFQTAMGITGVGALAWGIWELIDKETPPPPAS